MKILYLGDAPAAANYLKDILNDLEHEVTHADLFSQLPSLDGEYDLIIISDFPAKNINDQAAEKLKQMVRQGSHFLMLGGWDSFNGQGTNYHNHPLEEMLPVILQDEDDRVNAPQGLMLSADPSLSTPLAIDWQHPPIICGYNAVETKSDAQTLVWVKPIESDGQVISFLSPLPLVVRGRFGDGCVTACMTDLAPHWCGGLVDWGNTRRQFEHVETGSVYPVFVQFLITPPQS